MRAIGTAIELTKSAIEKKISNGNITQEKVDALSKELDMGITEYVRFQELKSLAVAMNWMTIEDGQQVYTYLGNSVETFNKQEIAVKVVLTELFKVLLEKQMKTK